MNMFLEIEGYNVVVFGDENRIAITPKIDDGDPMQSAIVQVECERRLALEISDIEPIVRYVKLRTSFCNDCVKYRIKNDLPLENEEDIREHDCDCDITDKVIKVADVTYTIHFEQE